MAAMLGKVAEPTNTPAAPCTGANEPNQSIRTSDPLARAIFAQVRHRSEVDRRFILGALQACESHVADERAIAIRDSLERFRLETGREPAYRAYEKWRVAQRDPSLVSGSALVRSFQGWNNAMRAVGFKASPDVKAISLLSVGAPISDDEVLEAARECARALGKRRFSYREYREWAEREARDPASRLAAVPIGHNTMARFGPSWVDLFTAAGLITREEANAARRVHFSDGQLLAALRRAARAVDGRLTYNGYAEWRRRELADAERRGVVIPIPSLDVYGTRFSSWGAALAEAGLISEQDIEAVHDVGRPKYENRFIATQLAAAARDLRPKMTREAYLHWRARGPRRLGEPVAPTARTIASRFPGGWREAVAILASAPPSQVVERLLSAMVADERDGRQRA